MSSVSRKSVEAFTIVEIMIVVAIIGLLVSIMGPRYSLGLNRAKARDSRTNLIMIHAANSLYRARNADCNYPSAGAACAAATGQANLTNTGFLNINNMNGTGSLNLLSNGATYSCLAAGTTCSAVMSNGCTLTLTLGNAITDTSADCNAGSNPKCEDCP